MFEYNALGNPTVVVGENSLDFCLQPTNLVRAVFKTYRSSIGAPDTNGFVEFAPENESYFGDADFYVGSETPTIKIKLQTSPLFDEENHYFRVNIGRYYHEYGHISMRFYSDFAKLGVVNYWDEAGNNTQNLQLDGDEVTIEVSIDGWTVTSGGNSVFMSFAPLTSSVNAPIEIKPAKGWLFSLSSSFSPQTRPFLPILIKY